MTKNQNLLNQINGDTSKMLCDVIETAVREAIRLQVQANQEYKIQCELEKAGKPYNFTSKHLLEEGVRACSNVLWRVFGGLPADCTNAIRKITEENKSHYLGIDNRDYTQLFLDAIRDR